MNPLPERAATRSGGEFLIVPSNLVSGASGHVRARLARLEPPQRLPGVDLARGVAVIGMFAAHLAVTSDLDWMAPHTWAGLAQGRSSILFATLAGVSMTLAMGSHRDRDEEAVAHAGRLVMARGFIVWILGVLLLTLMVPVYVILPAYGILFLIGARLLRLSTRVLWCFGAALASAAPFVVAAINLLLSDEDLITEFTGWNYPFVLWAAFIAVGIASGRLLLRAPTRHGLTLVAIGAILAVIGYGLLGPLGDRAPGRNDDAPGLGGWALSVLQDDPHSSGVGEAIGSGGFALASIGLCSLVTATGLRRIFWPLRAVGAMPLTAYTAQLLIWAIWIALERSRTGVVSPLDGFRALEPFWPMTIGVIAGCVLWAALVGRGPLEALVARLVAELVRPAEAPTSWSGRLRRHS